MRFIQQELGESEDLTPSNEVFVINTYWCLVGNGWGMGVAGIIMNSYCGSFPKIPC